MTSADLIPDAPTEYSDSAAHYFECLFDIQQTLNAPKDLWNAHGKYNYRSAESIILAVKPLLEKHRMIMTFADEPVLIADQIYIKSTLTLSTDRGYVDSVAAYAREDMVRKGMASPQCTGSASSFARKYALNAAFLIDDNKDADHFDNREQHIATVTAVEALELQELVIQSGTNEADFLKAYKIDQYNEMPKSRLDRAKEILTERLAVNNTDTNS